MTAAWLEEKLQLTSLSHKFGGNAVWGKCGLSKTQLNWQNFNTIIDGDPKYPLAQAWRPRPDKSTPNPSAPPTPTPPDQCWWGNNLFPHSSHLCQLISKTHCSVFCMDVPIKHNVWFGEPQVTLIHSKAAANYTWGRIKQAGVGERKLRSISNSEWHVPLPPRFP